MSAAERFAEPDVVRNARGRARFCPQVGTRRFDARPMLESEGLVLLFSLKELEEYDCLLFCLRVELSELLLLL